MESTEPRKKTPQGGFSPWGESGEQPGVAEGYPLLRFTARAAIAASEPMRPTVPGSGTR